jgi:putative Mg2+ transporter-C (MgtC) family protein
MTEFPALSWAEILDNLLHLAIAFALAVPIGWNREREEPGAGLRTFPLVAIGSCAFLLIGRSYLSGSESHARLLYGLMTGIGFIGGGSILKEGGSVSGTATAASIWNTGAIGAAVAWQRYEVAIALAVVNFALLVLGDRAKGWLGGRS